MQGAKPLAKRILQIYGEDGIALIVGEGGSSFWDANDSLIFNLT